MLDKYIEGKVSLAAGSMMLKWNMLDTHVHVNKLNIKPGDNVNVFINLETVLRNLSMQKNIQSLVNFYKQKVCLELESSILNLMAMYRMYFHKEKCNVKLYFYLTDLGKNHQQMEVYNKYYRSFYHNKYMLNPSFRNMGEVLNNTIIPELELIISYIPGCYLIKSKTFDSSIIPQAISTLSSDKNVIVTGDIFDTLYMFNPNFMVIYIKRRFQYFNVSSSIDDTVQSIIKGESPIDLNLFNSEMYYRLLLSIKGSKIRNISSAKGFGYSKFMKILNNGINEGIILRDFESLESIIELFPENYRSSIKEAFMCTSIDTQYQLLSDIDIEGIRNQIIDKSDIQSINSLNNKRFSEFPINISGLVE